MKRIIKIWDKKESINGVSAEIILQDRADLRNTEEVLLIGYENGVITNIELPEILRANLNLGLELSALEIGQKYIEHIEQQNVQAQAKVYTVEELQNRLKVSEQTTLMLMAKISKLEKEGVK